MSSSPNSSSGSSSSRFLFFTAEVSCFWPSSSALDSGEASLLASNPVPNRARNPDNLPASSSSTFCKALELGFHKGAFLVSRVHLYTGCGEVVRIVNALPSESVTSCVKVYGLFGRRNSRAWRHCRQIYDVVGGGNFWLAMPVSRSSGRSEEDILASETLGDWEVKDQCGFLSRCPIRLSGTRTVITPRQQQASRLDGVCKGIGTLKTICTIYHPGLSVFGSHPKTST